MMPNGDDPAAAWGAGRQVLVTGAGGFIGSHLVEDLVRRGARVRAFVRYNSGGRSGWLDRCPDEVRTAIEIVPGDLRDAKQTLAAVEGCGTVFNLGALISVPYSFEAPRSYVDVNVGGTLNVLEAVRMTGADRLVQISTSEVYGSAQFVPISESHPLVAQSPYAATKIAADQLALSYHRTFGLPLTVVRPFNAYGPRQSVRAVIPTIITQLAAGRRTITLGTLDTTRDFSFVTDVTAGMIAAAASDGAVGEVLNLGTGHDISIRDLANLIASLMGVEVSVETAAERLRPAASEVARLCSDTARMRSVAGWEPAFAGREGLARGLLQSIDWYSKPDTLKLFSTDTYVR